MSGICFVEVNSIYDLARLVCTFESIPFPCFSLNKEEPILGVQYENINDVILFYYTTYQANNEFLAYKYTTKEDVKFTNNTLDPTYTYSPIIYVKLFPKELKRINKRCKAILLNDINSLLKLSAYKMIISESPSTLFYFKNKLGAFFSLDNIETNFYYVELDSDPPTNFIRYNNTNSSSSFTNNLDEHGYIYNKIIRLKNKHPLVDL